MTSTLENHIFQNQQVPQGVMILTKIMPNIKQPVLSSLLKLVFDTIERKPIPPKSLERLSKKTSLEDKGDYLFSGLMILVQAIVRLPQDSVKETDLRQGLKELKFTDECCSEFLTMFRDNKVNLYTIKHHLCDFFLKIENFNWRIDVTISSNFLAKSLDTVIIFYITFKNGESKSFEMSIAKFHQLRFFISSMLREMEFLEKKSAFKT
ncbi:UNVERIFIED_CONTAM: hypothetical protein PYX00_003483 [Menopon gallinae]|uniref:COMM domain-containing protein 5 n=1 Tax=Menopon gallinae TaxID=328185 RepID=A0AAW2I0R5_9NEOP